MKRTTILLTDDEPNIRMMLRTALESDEYEILEASNGREALEVIKQHLPDLMLLDLNMPVLDGMAVLEQLKSVAINQKPRVVILTAYGSIAAAVKATRLGALDFLEKPITPTELRETVRSILNEPLLDAPNAPATPFDYQEVLNRIRRAMRSEDFASAESLLSKAADRKEQHSAAYFNLLGVLYEVQRKWRLAKKCYGKAMRADKKYLPAQANIRRIYELYTFGHSKQSVILGDEQDEMSQVN